MVLVYLFVFAVALLLALILTPFVIRLAYRIGAVDVPNRRKVHNRIMPRLGGVAVYLGFVAAMAVIVNLTYDRQILGMLLGGTVVLLLGVVDDIKGLPPLWKLAGQVLAAAIPVYFGIRVNFIHNPFDGYFHLGWMSIPVTMLWIVGITNAINLIDGLDGLASGVSFIALMIFSFMAMKVNQNLLISLLSVALAGAVLGFLRYNFHPAKIFLGDSGSMFLGFTIAVMAVMGLLKSVTLYTFITPILILGVPIFDTFFAILRRYKNNQPIFAADKAHLHHRLLNLGFSHRRAVLAIYCLALVFGLSAVFIFLRFS
ncbi:MAG: undecaprenyl/decaprenyl-phosphate alpha-N-acetylglucosaminyl 1-phosphate transferase [Firmicutes bacterium]|nr:undecaprenyl/decaprenyl-phosphate alpha-N-acetylglucosaminyl 1-phosphate transferase [Bacillota bacterium]